MDVELVAPLACSFAVRFSPHDSLLTWSEDRWGLIIPAGLMRTSSDDELAIAIGHQLAHLMIGLSATGIENLESEADVLGLYMTAAAGYDVSVAPALWERLAAESPFIIEPARWIGMKEFHLDLAGRIPRIRRTARQLHVRMVRGEAIRPAGAR
jgi:hypothetical protein